MRSALLLVLTIAVLTGASAPPPSPSSSPIPDQDWGYVQINAQYGSNMFWWYYGAMNENRTETPLVVWLQGGPGASSLFGDFIEIGPLDSNLQPRNYTWLKLANLIFIDNPVGSGWSYTKDPKGFSTTDAEIGENLVTVLGLFMAKYPEFAHTPLWIFAESYGGKMAVNFAISLQAAIKAGTIAANFKGVGLGDSWIAPVICMQSYGPYLQATSEVNQVEAANLTAYATAAAKALAAGDGSQATQLWGTQEEMYTLFTGNANTYNWYYHTAYDPDITKLMNGPIRKQLGIIPEGVTWGGQSNKVFSYLSNAFMGEAYTLVDSLLATGLDVVVYSGQLDIIVNVDCIDGWINQLTWPSLSAWQNAERVSFSNAAGNATAFLQEYQNFHFWNILYAGHMVPLDNPEAGYMMLQYTLSKQ